MNSTDRQQVARAIGVFVTLIVLARPTSGAPPTPASPRGDGATPVESAQPVCGGPVISSAPRMVICDSGGDGATSCQTKQIISVGGFGSTSGCGISCANGYYACCQSPSLTSNAQCSCEQNPTRGPWTPESPW